MTEFTSISISLWCIDYINTVVGYSTQITPSVITEKKHRKAMATDQVRAHVRHIRSYCSSYQYFDGFYDRCANCSDVCQPCQSHLIFCLRNCPGIPYHFILATSRVHVQTLGSKMCRACRLTDPIHQSSHSRFPELRYAFIRSLTI